MNLAVAAFWVLSPSASDEMLVLCLPFIVIVQMMRSVGVSNQTEAATGWLLV